MGKNQTHKSMQMAKHSSRGGGGAGDEVDTRYNGHDASFHTAEWHAARLAALQMERPSWDDWKKQQDEAAAREAAMEAAQQDEYLEYKAGLEADRARLLGHTKDGGVKKREAKDAKRDAKKDSKKSKKRKHKSKDKKKHKKSSKDKRSKKKKRRHSSSSGSGSSSDSDSSSSSSDQDYGGMGSPVRLSKFLNA